MNFNHPPAITFGDLIVSVYSACNPRLAKAIVRFAVNTQLIVFKGEPRIEISSRQSARNETNRPTKNTGPVRLRILTLKDR